MTNRTDEFGSRVPKGFSSSGYTGLDGVADEYGGDKSSRLEQYEGYQYFPKENDTNLSLYGGSGRDVFLSYSDQALYDDDRIDNYFDILDFNPVEDFLILPFLTSDGVKITQKNLFIVADIGSGVKDRIFKLSKRAEEHNIGFADQFDSAKVKLNGFFLNSTKLPMTVQTRRVPPSASQGRISEDSSTKSRTSIPQPTP